ncbi:MAG: DUF5522 domain-containing protein [Chitinophagales bacterium]
MHSKLQEGIHYYLDKDSGLLVFTGQYHRERGYCCNSGCRHCPYKDECTPENENHRNDSEGDSKYSA